MRAIQKLVVILTLACSSMRAQSTPPLPQVPAQTYPSEAGQLTSTTTSSPIGSSSATPTRSESIAPQPGFYVTYGAMGIVLMALLLGILRGLRGWSLSDALSEDTGNGVLKASVSRLIALLGFVVIICIYLGTGCGVIFRLLAGGDIANLSGLGTFLIGAAALFTPYIANQIKGAVVGVANGPQIPPPGPAAGTASGPQTSVPGS